MAEVVDGRRPAAGASADAATVPDGQAPRRAEAMRDARTPPPGTPGLGGESDSAHGGLTPGAIASQSAPAHLQQRAIEGEEHAAAVVRMRAALLLGVCIWPVWLLVDWMV